MTKSKKEQDEHNCVFTITRLLPSTRLQPRKLSPAEQ